MSQRGDESHVGAVEDISVMVEDVQVDANLPNLLTRSDTK